MTRREHPDVDEAEHDIAPTSGRADGAGPRIANDVTPAGSDVVPKPLSQNAGARGRVRRVALVTLDQLDPHALCYVLNACQRMDAKLDILTDLPPEDIDRAVIGARNATDISWRINQVGDDWALDIARYARNESGLLFLASGAGDKKAQELRDKSGPNGMRLGIAWVIVEAR